MAMTVLGFHPRAPHTGKPQLVCGVYSSAIEIWPTRHCPNLRYRRPAREAPLWLDAALDVGERTDSPLVVVLIGTMDRSSSPTQASALASVSTSNTPGTTSVDRCKRPRHQTARGRSSATSSAVRAAHRECDGLDARRAYLQHQAREADRVKSALATIESRCRLLKVTVIPIIRCLTPIARALGRMAS
ncbi:hypothetical protein PC118_g17056 [Phytophthora cactorum]|uniref:Uncharacterized protein n=1 Tax=Phytophthora cactorum TaxID=29920 RepID=A0A8T1FGZ9_9STRA|nr:hypothetical protein PC113_g15329 [Phytophthora cactorum]KAG2970138.1 hypothetical protein PC118_g17056 [Phytophthora cactorum]